MYSSKLISATDIYTNLFSNVDTDLLVNLVKNEPLAFNALKSVVK